MALLKLLVAVALVVCVSAFPSIGRSNDDYSDTIKSIQSHGYPAETHQVITSDGYILNMHRIPHGKGQSPSGDRPVIFLMHGLMGASDNYILLGPELAQAYIYADAGFDVWMGNARGNGVSRSHVTLNPDNSRDRSNFFDFSFEEIALYDMPAMIDYALEKSGKEKLHYIGHSQGGTVFLILCSMRPEYNDKMVSVNLLAGVGYQKYFPNSDLANLALITNTLHLAATTAGMVELFPPVEDDTVEACFGNPGLNTICEMVGMDTLIDAESVDGLRPAGAALKQVSHYGQNIRDKKFRRWNYSIIQNMIVYGTSNPPEYDLSKITADVTMHYTLGDVLLAEGDVLDMAAVMPNCKVRKVAKDTFLHVDFVSSEDSKELVTDYILSNLKAIEKLA